jgi:hypothetical protein
VALATHCYPLWPKTSPLVITHRVPLSSVSVTGDL